jgi:hypothetical protein
MEQLRSAFVSAESLKNAEAQILLAQSAVSRINSVGFGDIFRKNEALFALNHEPDRSTS